MKRTPPTAPPTGPERTPEHVARPSLRSGEVCAMLGIAPTTLWRWLKALPDFPQPERYRLAGRNVTRWRVEDIEAWMAKQSDMAWRRNAPAAAVPLFTPAGLDAGKRALFCAYLLDLSPFEVFPFERASDPAACQHLFEYVRGRVRQLRADVPEPNPTNAELMAYLRTLTFCEAVLDNRARPEIPGARGFENRRGHRRGIYLCQEVGHDD